MPGHVDIGPRQVGAGEPCFVVAELGANFNGDVHLCLRMIDAAHAAGADAVKLQKRDPSMLCIPAQQRNQPKDSPWGILSYADYRRRLELDASGYDIIATHCRYRGIPWFASAWDEPSVDFLMKYDPSCLKVPSACLTDLSLLHAMRRTGRPIIASTGMSDEAQIASAVAILGPDRLVLLHCVSTYPAPVETLNLLCIPWLRERFQIPVGYSGHETGISTSLCAVVLGASVLERHFTTDRTLFGTDQAASLEPRGFATLVRDVRKWERARGTGIKTVSDAERAVLHKLRRFP